jgi:hypothetical protein
MEEDLKEIRDIYDLYPLQDIFNMDETRSIIKPTLTSPSPLNLYQVVRLIRRGLRPTSAATQMAVKRWNFGLLVP